MTQANDRVEAVVHPVDSLLGIILTLVIFEASILVSYYGAFYPGSNPDFSLFIVSLVIFSVMAWIIGALAQLWPVKLTARWATLWILLIELSLLLYNVMGKPLGTTGFWAVLGIILLVPASTCSVFLYCLVRTTNTLSYGVILIV